MEVAVSAFSVIFIWSIEMQTALVSSENEVFLKWSRYSIRFLRLNY